MAKTNINRKAWNTDNSQTDEDDSFKIKALPSLPRQRRVNKNQTIVFHASKFYVLRILPSQVASCGVVAICIREKN